MTSNSGILLSKGYVVDNNYTVLFFIKESKYCQSYRVKNANGQLGFLKLFNAGKMPPFLFDAEGNLLEISILKKLSHPNIAKYQSSHEVILNQAKYFYVVTDFISGETVADKQHRDSVLDIYDTREIIEPILNGLNYLHNLEEPIIHNEITNLNIMLDLSGGIPVPKIIDFGHARYLHQSSKTYSRDGLDLHYIANECFNGVFSPQSDLFSVGVLMYHLLFGLPPWYVDAGRYNSKKKGLAQQVLEQRKRPLFFLDIERGANSGVDDNTLNIIRKATHPNIDIRFKSAKEFLRALNGDFIVELDEKVTSPVITKASVPPTNFKPNRLGKGFDRIAGMQSLKEMLYNDVIRALNEKDLYETYGLTIPNGLLLYGPPGCGKTFIAESFAEEVQYNFVQIKPSDLASIYVHGSQEKIGKLFDEAKKNAPTIIFIDELDAVMPSRDGDLSHSYSAEVNEFLAQMTNCSEHGIFIIGATNRPDKIDPAILRTGRLDKHIYLPPPDSNAREQMFKLHLKKRPIEIDIDFGDLSEKTANYVSSDIEFICNEAARIALKEKGRISNYILDHIIGKTKSSVSIKDLNRYEEMRMKIEQKDEVKQKRNTIGFKSNIRNDG